MTTFSERYGYKPARTALGQYESMDERLRVEIWNLLFGGLESMKFVSILDDLTNTPITPGFPSITPDYAAYKKLEWNEVYDLVESCMLSKKSAATNKYERNSFQRYVGRFNSMLAEEGSAYRLLNGTIVPIIGEQEIAEVEKASESSEHTRKAIGLLANREHPDPENVIKESVSAVEYAVREATGLDIERGLEKLAIHSQLAQAWKNMYNWASDEPGVRHAKPEPSEVGMAEARYVLVAASAFVNYLKFKGYSG